MSQVSRKRNQLDMAATRSRGKSPGVRKTNKEKLDLSVTETSSTNTTKPVKRKRKKEEESQIEPLAKYFLQMISNLDNPERPITSWLRVARIVRPVSYMGYIHKLIMKYINNSQNPEYGFGIQVLDIVEIHRIRNFAPEFTGNRTNNTHMLLWHGTPEKNLASILINGFQIPQSTGQLFGPGIYFADRASISALFCCRGRPDTKAYYLLLCDVLVGNAYDGLKSYFTFTSPPENYDSVIGIGRNIPNPSDTVYYNGLCIPVGKSVPNSSVDLGRFLLEDNEYVIYKKQNVRPLYLVRFEFAAKPFCNRSNKFFD
ncbi:unnamed protein product [Orchesella dallaii]|uniref:Poly [ADP-ribose] polymerase n=1 Tax=Orchesella dallaii TaxID=48710 RepID=A0ABP1RQ93_9HEXA